MPRRPLPSVESLRCFVAAAQHLSFRRAAMEVGLTPAALSQRIKQLEDMLDCVLFERSPQHVALTPAGQALLERARPALDAVGACAEVGDAKPARVRVTVATRFELGMSWLLPALIDLRRERPGIHVDLVFGSSGEVLTRLEQGSVDATVTSAPVADSAWQSEVLHAEEYVLVGSPELLSSKPFDRIEDAAQHMIIDIDGELPLARYALSACPGLEFGDLWRCGTGGAVVALARAGQGVAVVPFYMVRGDLDVGRLVRLLPELTLLSDTFRLIFRKTSPAVDTLKELAGWLRDRPLA